MTTASLNLLSLLRKAQHTDDEKMQKLLQEIQNAVKRQEELSTHLDNLWRMFGETVQQERKEKRITLVELGKAMGVSKSALSYMESGQRSWTVELAAKAVAALK